MSRRTPVDSNLGDDWALAAQGHIMFVVPVDLSGWGVKNSHAAWNYLFLGGTNVTGSVTGRKLRSIMTRLYPS